MAIGVTAKGGTFASAATSVSLASVAANAADLVVMSANLGATGATATWNGISMSLAVTKAYTGAVSVYIFYLVVVSGATGSVTLSWAGSHTGAILVSTIQGIATGSPLDQVSSGSGAGSTSPTSTATPTTTQASEIAFGAIGCNVNSIGGSWSNAWSDNQTEATALNNTLNEGFLILSSTGAQTAAKTGTTSLTNYGACCATFKGAVYTRSSVLIQAVNRATNF